MGRKIANGDTGLLSRTITNEQVNNWFNVETYGAVHDGVTDDTEAIQWAINAAFTAGGGIVYCPNGVYIISGALQGVIGGVDYNSQIYIPASPVDSSETYNVTLLGESWNWIPPVFPNYGEHGVVFKSTIAGTGTNPAVIRSKGLTGAFGDLNYHTLHIENITVLVDANEGATGPTMCGIDMSQQSSGWYNNITVSIDADRTVMVEPTNHVFGFAAGMLNNDFPRIGKIVTAGFYYGTMLGEGVHALDIHCYYNVFGLIGLRTKYGVNIDYAVLAWNKYAIGSQQETFNGITRNNGYLNINQLNIEDGYSGDGRTPAWCYFEDYINDDINLLHGRVSYQLSSESGYGYDITKSNGGKNLLVRNLVRNQTYSWTTTNRPVPSSYKGILGYNETTNKLEYWNDTTWIELE